jgi:hypothetical protein
MRLFDPLQQRTGEVQPGSDRRMAREDLDERQVRLRVGALHYIVKIPHRLVRMNEQDKLELRHPGPR